MPERTVTVGSQTGLHARPAKLFVQAATRQPVKVRIQAGDREVDARSMLAVLSLGVTHGTEVTLRAEGEEAEAVLDELAGLLARDLDAEDPVDA
jgi:phosphocarrier protein HPr